MPKQHKFKPGDVVVWGPWAKLYISGKGDDFNPNTWPDQPPFLVVDSIIQKEDSREYETCGLANIATREPVLSKVSDGRWYWEWLELDPFLTAVHRRRKHAETNPDPSAQ